jgi:hypothetical protein
LLLQLLPKLLLDFATCRKTHAFGHDMIPSN